MENGKLLYKLKTKDGAFRVTLEIVEPSKGARESKLKQRFEDKMLSITEFHRLI